MLFFNHSINQKILKNSGFPKKKKKREKQHIINKIKKIIEHENSALPSHE